MEKQLDNGAKHVEESVDETELQRRLKEALGVMLKTEKNIERFTKVITKLVDSEATDENQRLGLYTKYVTKLYTIRTTDTGDEKDNTIPAIYSFFNLLTKTPIEDRDWIHSSYEKIIKLEKMIREPLKGKKGIFKCRNSKCGKMNTLSIEVQKRSGDEGTTSFVFCLDCDHHFQQN